LVYASVLSLFAWQVALTAAAGEKDRP
jgi:hypothetical protein